MPGQSQSEVGRAQSERDFLHSRTRRRFRVILAGGGVLIVGIVVAVIWAGRVSEPEIGDLMENANAALARKDFAGANRFANQILRREPENASALLVSGKCRMAQGRLLAAVEILSKVPSSQSAASSEAAFLAGNILFLHFHRPSDAEKFYLKSLRDSPDSYQANNGLAILLGVSGQWWRQIPPRLAAIRTGKLTRLDLFVLALGEKAIDESNVGPFQAASPNDPLVQLAVARLAVEDEQLDSAIELLKLAIQESPELARAHVLLGEIYFERGDEQKFVKWNRNLPTIANDHPSVWVVRGKWAQRHGRPQVALRCLSEAIQRDPNHPDALYQAGRILLSMKRVNEAAPFLQRAKTLQEFLNATKAADTEESLTETKAVAVLAEALGNYWEAFGWASLAAAHRDSPDWARSTMSRMKKEISKLSHRRTHPDFNPITKFNYHALPLPLISNSDPAPVTKNPSRRSSDRFSFKDRSDSAGIPFKYFNGSPDVANGVKHMYEVMGGGIAVLDFNADNLPDLYFTQGSRWPVDESKSEHLDRLYLNAGHGRFVDVTSSCGIHENRFSQGVSIGDVDSDGFPDILVANIGRNRLYHNNGDGTFSDISEDVGLKRSDWTTSCAIADLSGDGHPELYFVNYLKGDDVFTRTCGPQDAGVCLPQHFPAADDRLFWSRGNGRFQDVTQPSGINVANGKGLGIVVGSFGRSPGVNIFVGNDTVANFFFENRSTNKNEMPHFRENALLMGLALNHGGTAQACMGIAAGDADGDGITDLFVTNFHGEPNALYRQQPDGLFVDEALKRRLRQPSLSKLGFGTQFLDADLDGRLDLIVANGHIDNFSRDGRTEYQMRPQFFENQGEAGFREADPRSLGPYFSRKVLGRSLVRLDWNRDGKDDVVVSHLDGPIALLENTTRTVGGFLALRLRGVQSSRDAIGTVVYIKTASHSLTRQLTAGDGFHASNERILSFGLGEETIINKMRVEWPSGRREDFANIPANSRWILVEGSGQLLSAPAD